MKMEVELTGLIARLVETVAGKLNDLTLVYAVKPE